MRKGRAALLNRQINNTSPDSVALHLGYACWVRTKVRSLLALGTSKRQAILTALSSKSYWHLSKTLATQTGMTNDWLASQGLISVRALWMRAHGYT